MQIPANRLLNYLTPGIAYDLRRPDDQRSLKQSDVPYTEAVALAIRGEIGAIAKPSGRIKYLIELPESERTPAPELATVGRERESKGTINARTNIGVYLQEVESARMDEYGLPTRIIVGHTWAFSMLRGAGL